jgi:hypothetical protein
MGDGRWERNAILVIRYSVIASETFSLTSDH